MKLSLFILFKKKRDFKIIREKKRISIYKPKRSIS